MYKTFNYILNQWQYVAPEGYSFFYQGHDQGRVIFTASPEGYYIQKIED